MGRGRQRTALSAALIVMLLALLVVLQTLDGEPPETAPAVAGQVEVEAPAAPSAADQQRAVPVAESGRTASAPATLARSLAGLQVEVRGQLNGELLWDARVLARVGRLVLASGVTDGDGRWATELALDEQELTLEVAADGYRTSRQTIELRARQRTDVGVALAAADGWYGRVTTELGDPLASVSLRVRRRWPPRPVAILGTAEQLASRPVQVSGPLDLLTDRAGTYRVPDLPQDGVVELLIQVRGAEWTSDVLRVPLPLAFGDLPDLVVEPNRALSVRVLDRAGDLITDTSLLFDATPGPWRMPDAAVRFAVPGSIQVSHAGSDVRLAVAPGSGRWLVEASAGGQPLVLEPTARPPDPESLHDHAPRAPHWARVPDWASEVDVVVAPGAVVVGRVLSSLHASFVQRALVRLWVDGVSVDVRRTDSNAEFRFDLQPELLGVPVTVAIHHPDYDSLTAEISPWPANAVGETTLYLDSQPAEAVQIAAGYRASMTDMRTRAGLLHVEDPSFMFVMPRAEGWPPDRTCSRSCAPTLCRSDRSSTVARRCRDPSCCNRKRHSSSAALR